MKFPGLATWGFYCALAGWQGAAQHSLMTCIMVLAAELAIWNVIHLVLDTIAALRQRKDHRQ